MVSSTTPSNSKSVDELHKNTENAAPSTDTSTNAEDTPPSYELAPITSSSYTMDCATLENRDESSMDVDSEEIRVEKGESDSQVHEVGEKSHEELMTKKSEERTVRPKEANRMSEPSTSQEGGSADGSKADEVMKSIEESAGLSLDEYAKRRIHALLEKEEEVQIMKLSFSIKCIAKSNSLPKPMDSLLWNTKTIT